MADEPNLTGEEEDERQDDEERRPRRSSSTATRRPQTEVRLERKLIGGLKQLGGIVSRRNETLGEIIIEDSEKMGRLLALFVRAREEILELRPLQLGDRNLLGVTLQ